VAKDSPSRLARALFILLGLLMLGAAWMWHAGYTVDLKVQSLELLK
jgi:hypothetical protein